MTEIYPPNPQWNYILFRLQVILADPSIQLTRIFKFHSNFDPKHDLHMKIDAAIEASNLQQEELDILKYGNPTRHIFEAGHIKLIEPANKTQQRTPMRRTMLLFKLAVNQCLPIHKSGVGELSTLTEFPPEIDTLYVSDSKEQLNIYPHKYRVKDRSQVCIEYEVEYISRGASSLRKWQPDHIICEYCQAQKAAYFCNEDKQLYCMRCFEDTHRSNKKKTHHLDPITPYNSASFCSFHPKDRLTHYCFECRELRCEKCLRNEMTKPQNKHTENIHLVELAKTFQQKQSAFLEEAKTKTQNLLLKVEAKIKSINKNYEIQQRDLEEKFAAKLARVHEQTNKDISKCLALHAELKRKYDQFLWLQNFMGYCQGFMPADDSIRMKDAFATELEKLTSREYFHLIEGKIENSGSLPY